MKIAAANVDHVILLIGISGPTEIKTYRYEWRTYPCQFMKCAIYTKDTGLPGPPWLYYGQIHVVEKSKYTIRDGQLVEKEL